jgi:hypothetical protein
MIAAGLAHQGLVSARGARGAEIGANSRDAAGGPGRRKGVREEEKEEEKVSGTDSKIGS